MQTVYFDASRLFLRSGRFSPTGIDRVVLAYGRWLAARPDVRVIPVWSRLGYLSRLSSVRFNRLLAQGAPSEAHAAKDEAGSPAWDALAHALQHPGPDPGLRPAPTRSRLVAEVGGYAGAVASAVARPAQIALQKGAVFVNVNHYGLEHPHLLRRLSAAGVRPVVLIHDLIPVRYPEYCSPGGEGRHARRLEGVLRYAARVIVNSQATADDLARFAEEGGLPLPACIVAPLGLEPTFTQDQGPAFEAPPYFVCVGTLEPRKNLVLLLQVWRRLAERLGEKTPRLVLVGRRGWENEAIVDLLERSPLVVRYVHEVDTLGDRELARLIRGAAALVSPSFAEGFNLPVVEALSLGTPVIASDIAVHRELAAGAQLIDPLDGPAWIEAIAAQAKRPRRAKRRFKSPTWEGHFERAARAFRMD
jgi:glycosyltransferase involved in cell wall biosynthesis